MPSSVRVVPASLKKPMGTWSSEAELTVSFGPGAHSIGMASRAVLARHHVSATTATPPLKRPDGGNCTTECTPGRFRIALKS